MRTKTFHSNNFVKGAILLKPREREKLLKSTLVMQSSTHSLSIEGPIRQLANAHAKSGVPL
jgi:hypothetical protein